MQRRCVTLNIVNLFEHTILSNGYNHRSVFQENVFTLAEPISVRESSVTRQSSLGLWQLLLRRKTVSLICALKTAGKKDVLTIAFTGKDGDRTLDAANYCLHRSKLQHSSNPGMTRDTAAYCSASHVAMGEEASDQGDQGWSMS